MLTIHLQSITTENKRILKDIDLAIKEGEICVLKGQNGSGKSTLAKAILGFPHLQILGKISFNNEDITELPMYKRVQKGIFLASQSPIAISGIKLQTFLRNMYLQMEYIQEKVDLLSFKKILSHYLKKLNLSPDILQRDLNVGFSGGESKKIEFLQLLLLQPSFAILDEIDSGLDNESRERIFRQIKDFAREGMGILVISHREKIESELKADKVYRLDKQTLVNE